MRLDFNVLWVENQQDLVQSQKEKLDRQVRSEGFRLQVKFVASVDEAVQCLSDDVYSDHVDLILMDYDLGPGKKGDDGLVEVRARIPYRDVIFYSSQANDLLQLVLQRGVHGVYCSTREDLPDTSIGVFEGLVKKVIDIDHSRGIVMGTTSDIDHFVMDALAEAFDKSTPEIRSKALTRISEDVKKIRSRFEESLAAITAAQHPSDLFEQHAVYTSVDRLHLLRKILKENPGLQVDDVALASYAQNAMPKRNILAHVRVEVDGFTRRLVDRKGVEHTSDHMKQLRLELLQHHENFEALSGKLKEK
jgi:CheY-like chemotaxis protein